jgi:hypothetical protein
MPQCRQSMQRSGSRQRNEGADKMMGPSKRWMYASRSGCFSRGGDTYSTLVRESGRPVHCEKAPEWQYVWRFVAGALLYLPWLLGIDAAAYAAGSHLAGIALHPLLMLPQPASVALLWCVAGWLVWRSVRGEAEPAVRSTHPASQQAPNETGSGRL